MFLRPRRFGKSLFTSILEAYYDVRYADRFDEFFSGTDIGANPTGERGKYLVLRFDFSTVSKDAVQVQESFNKYAADCCDARCLAHRCEGAVVPRQARARGGRGLAKAWRLNSGASGESGRSGTSGESGLPPVTLHRLVMVFHGGACVVSEEV